MEQEYLQFSEDSLKEIVKLIFKARIQLGAYWETRNEELYKKMVLSLPPNGQSVLVRLRSNQKSCPKHRCRPGCVGPA